MLKSQKRPIYCLLIILITIFAAVPVGFSEEKSIDDYWRETGMSFEYAVKNFTPINNKVCHIDLHSAARCLYQINRLLSTVIQGRKHGEYVILPGSASSVFKKHDKEVIPLTGSKNYVIYKLNTPGEDYLEGLKALNEKNREVLDFWEIFIRENGREAFDVDSIMEAIKSQYINYENQLDAAKAIINAWATMTFYDHSRFEPNDYRAENFSKDKKSFYGIGALLRKEKGKGLVILKIFQGGGAKEAGLISFDRILEVDGRSTVDVDLSESVKRIKGQEGTTVTLLIKRKDETFQVEVERKKVTVKNVEYELINHQDLKIGNIKLGSFTPDSSCNQVKAAIRGLERRGAKKLILDLRGNGGGLLEMAICISELFLDKDRLIVSTRYLAASGADSSSGPDYFYISQKNPITRLPLVILQDNASASASEIVAGALMDNNRALIVGRRSFGKGTVQAGMRLGNNKKIVIFATVRRFYRPNGYSNQLIGISPHFDVKRKIPEEEEEIPEIREQDLAFNPVPADGEMVPGKPSAELQDCVREKGIAELLYDRDNSGGVPHSHDFQMLYALDVAYCATESSTVAHGNIYENNDHTVWQKLFRSFVD